LEVSTLSRIGFIALYATGHLNPSMVLASALQRGPGGGFPTIAPERWIPLADEFESLIKRIASLAPAV
jgi:hypothetical protein